MTITPCEVLQNRGGWAEDQLAGRCKFPIAPFNTYSNIAYLLAGIFAVTAKPNWAGIVFGLAMAFLAVGSALYHGTKEIWAAQLDHAGMYTVFTSLTIFLLSPTNPFIWTYMAVGATIVAWRLTYATKWEALLYPMMGVFIVISTLAVILNGLWSFAVVSLGIFGIAYGIWWQDKKHTFLFPRLGHAVFHILTAIAILLLFLGA